MKKILFISFLATVFLFTGCPQKTPTVDTTGTDKDVSTQNADSKLDGISAAEKERIAKEEMEKELARLIAMLEQNSNKIYFEFDKFDVTAEMQNVIVQNAKLFNTPEAQKLTVKVEGNCDEWGTDEYNYALGLKRAKAVKDALVAQGVSESRISIISYGESNPACTAATKSCWDQNRRAEFKFLP